MKAKDIKWCPQHGYPLPCDKCGLGQFELGKQAGIKEVVEWIRKHQLVQPDNNSITQFYPFYQIEERELKEWGCKLT